MYLTNIRPTQQERYTASNTIICLTYSKVYNLYVTDRKVENQ